MYVIAENSADKLTVVRPLAVFHRSVVVSLNNREKPWTDDTNSLEYLKCSLGRSDLCPNAGLSRY